MIEPPACHVQKIAGMAALIADKLASMSKDNQIDDAIQKKWAELKSLVAAANSAMTNPPHHDAIRLLARIGELESELQILLKQRGT